MMGILFIDKLLIPHIGGGYLHYGKWHVEGCSMSKIWCKNDKSGLYSDVAEFARCYPVPNDDTKQLSSILLVFDYYGQLANQ